MVIRDNKVFHLEEALATFSPRGVTFRLHLLHLSIDFSGSKRDRFHDVEGRCPYGWTFALSLSSFSSHVYALKEPPPRANRNQVQLSRDGFWAREKSRAAVPRCGVVCFQWRWRDVTITRRLLVGPTERRRRRTRTRTRTRTTRRRKHVREKSGRLYPANAN